MKNSLKAIENQNSTILILGSLPGEESLKQQQYYAHPRNAFWKIISEILNVDLPVDYNQRCDLVLQNNIALWDVIESANREGSLDTAIKNETPNDLIAFLNQHTKITKILINGGKATKSFAKFFKGVEIPVYALPSTSPAYAGMKYADKLEKWKTAITE